MQEDSNDVWLTVVIKPAFTIEITSDSTGKNWNGHYSMGRTIKEALIPWLRLPVHTKGPYEGKTIRFRKAKER